MGAITWGQESTGELRHPRGEEVGTVFLEDGLGVLRRKRPRAGQDGGSALGRPLAAEARMEAVVLCCRRPWRLRPDLGSEVRGLEAIGVDTGQGWALDPQDQHFHPQHCVEMYGALRAAAPGGPVTEPSGPSRWNSVPSSQSKQQWAKLFQK